MDFKIYLEKLRNLPDAQKRIILWTIVVVLGLIMGIFWIKSAMNGIQEISKSASNVKLPEMNLPQVPDLSKAGTVDWKTYTNSNAGYEIKYHPALEITHKMDESGWDDHIIFKSDTNENLFDCEILKWKNADNKTAKELAGDAGDNPRVNDIITDTVVGGIQGSKVVSDGLSIKENSTKVINNSGIYIIKDSNVYYFYCINKITENGQVKKYNFDIFDLMLSTFKFTK